MMDRLYFMVGYKCYRGSVFESRALKRISRDSDEYLRACDFIFDAIQSCDKQEAIGWLQRYISQAIEYDGTTIADVVNPKIMLATNKKEAAALFLAAYDFYREILA